MPTARRVCALVLAAFQVGDLVVTQVAPRYGGAHLDALGVPRAVRPALPAIKAAAVIALVATVDRRRPQRATAAGLVAYYSAAATFHVLSRDRPTDAAPAVVCAALAATIAV